MPNRPLASDSLVPGPLPAGRPGAPSGALPGTLSGPGTGAAARFARWLAPLCPGILLCLAVTIAAEGGAWLERALFGRAALEDLVLAILLGAALRTAWTPGASWQPGISFSAKRLLEAAVVLLGFTIRPDTLLAAGPLLPVVVAAVVALAIAASYAMGRLLGLPPRLATLVACGNGICGNAAIVAVAPVIGANGRDVAASIAFTALFGVMVVLGLPLLGAALGLHGLRFGTLAGLTVYAVPQVLAAAAPMGPAAVQFGTLVKLVRVLMLGPVCLALALIARRATTRAGGAAPGGLPTPNARRLVPAFILGFLAAAACRAAGLVPPVLLAPIGAAATALTVISMAALGLGTDIRAVVTAGPRVSAAVTFSLGLLLLISLGLLRVLPIG